MNETILYNLTVTDRHGTVLQEVTHTSPSSLVQHLPEIRNEAERKLRQNEDGKARRRGRPPKLS